MSLRTEEQQQALDTRADELGCAPVVVPVVERLERVIALLELLMKAHSGDSAPMRNAEKQGE